MLLNDVDNEVVAEDSRVAPHAIAELSDEMDWSYMGQNNLFIYSRSPDIEFTLKIFSVVE